MLETTTDLPKTRADLVARVVALIFFIQFLDSTIIATSLPQMADQFGVDPVALGSGFTVYMLAMAALIPPAAWVADRFGARRVLVVSLALFVVASVLCGLSTSLPQFLLARAAQGAAAAMMTPVGRLVVLRHAAKADVIHAVSIITWPALFAPVVGPIAGAWITTHVGWQWNFFVNVPIGAVGVALLVAFVPAAAPQPGARFDTVGFVASAVAVAALVGALETFSHKGHDGLAVAGLVAAAAVGAFAVRHLRRSAAPLFDLGVLAVREFALATLTAGMLGRIAVNATPFLLPLLFQVGYGLDAVATGGLMLVYFAGNLAMKTATTRVMRRFGFRTVLTVNGVLTTATIAAFGVLPPDAPHAVLLAALFAAGLARSMQFTALNTLTFAEVDGRHRGDAATLSSLLQQIAAVLGVALGVAAIRLAQVWHGGGAADATTAADFRAAFLVMAAAALVSAVGFLRLSPAAGDEVAGRA
jgi:EmrB/QacA subfamily drug resistance transporter